MLKEEFMKRLSAIEEEQPNETDIKMRESIGKENDGTLYSMEQVSAMRKQYKQSGDLHVRVASSLHKEIADKAKAEGISLNQYVATALAYYAGRNSTER